jgi:peptide/nickel transport system ATP-binding protein
MRCGRQVAESIKQHDKLSERATREKVIDLFKKVKLPRPRAIYRSYPHEISGGQKQRVMIAMAIANNPKVLIADEPTTALDVTVQKEIIQLLNELREDTGMGLLFISHDLGVVSEVAEHVAVMYKGQIVETGLTQEVFKNPVHPYTKGLLACRPPLDKRLERLPTVDEFLDGDSGVETDEKQVDPKDRKAAHHQMYEQEALMDVRELEKKYLLSRTLTGKPNYLSAVDRVSLKVYPGETLGLVGESGCGKTTLGRSILRLIEPDAGVIFYQEEDLLKMNHTQLKLKRRDLNIIFQDPYSSLNPRRSIGEAIVEPMKVHGLYRGRKQRKQQALELLEKVGLQKDHFYRYPHEFSGGQRQRIVIARALALQPKFIICDEAVSALDVSVQARILNLLNDLKRTFGFTYIFISHDLSVVRFMSDRIMVMKEGKIIETGEADELYEHPKEAYTRQLIAAVPAG